MTGAALFAAGYIFGAITVVVVAACMMGGGE
jgi:hypothetical protein